jgi:hypothetical protein
VSARDFSHDAADSYFVAQRAVWFKMLLTAERWAEPDEEFDLVLAAALMRGRP